MRLKSTLLHKISVATILAGVLCASLVFSVNATEAVIYSDGFESADGEYTHGGILDAWEWGTPSPGYTDGPAAAHAGNKCWGTDLDDTVPFNMNAYLVSPAIVLPTLGENQVMRVRFFGWIAVDLMVDRGQFQVSSNGYDWESKADLLHTMLGGWNEYVFDISEHSADTIFLRFRCVTDNENTFDPPNVPYNMAGFYIDDIAITVTDAPSIKKIMTFEGSENQSSIASCPWLYVPYIDKKDNRDFKRENDIFSTARGVGAEYTDFYLLNNFMEADENDKYVLKLKETEQEESFSDLFTLVVVDHAANVEIAPDENGNIFTFKSKKDPEKPSTAVDKNGKNVRSLIKDTDEIGYKAYNGDYINLDFSSIGSVQHPIFLLRAQGFMVDTSAGDLTGVPPRIFVQTQNSGGQWVTRNTFYPRWKSALCGYDMNGLFPYAKKIRLLASSCHTGKYQLIDWAAISKQVQKPITITELTPHKALRSDGADLTENLSTIDGNYAHLAANEEIKIKFNASSKDKEKKRDFIVKSRGYYIPSGTYFFYTWDGVNWVQRDGWSLPTDGDQTREFDFSLWLPDQSGQNRVRIWQDFILDPAAIDFVGMRRDSVDLIMNYATDMRDTSSILNLLNISDNQRLEWDWGENWPYRNRWVEIGWVDSFVNTQPSTNPVFITNTGSVTPTINWTYFDLDGSPQNQYEIEVWEGPGGTGSNLWDPPAGSGTAVSAVYGGISLTTGQQYYARVKAADSLSWGGWSEAAFVISSNNPPVAVAGNDTLVIASEECFTSVVLNGAASYDPDGDTLSYLWTGPFGTANGAVQAVFLYPDTALIKLIVSDGKGGSGTDSVTIIIRDTVAPIPDSSSLSGITGECLVTITSPPTATDNCAGLIVGTTDSLTFPDPGIHTVIWHFTDPSGNVATQLQTVTITDNSAPIPDSATLPVLSGECFVVVTQYPTATDGCAGTIVGITSDSLSYTTSGTYSITWRYDDNNGNVTVQTQSVVVVDDSAPVPDAASLPDLQSNCFLSVSTFPTATDNCKGPIVATTADPLTYSQAGTYIIHWTYDDGNGNTSSQTQTAIVIDNTPPVPSVSPLPTINGFISGGRCYTVRAYPTAMDNCKGRIVGITSSPLVYCNKGVFTIVWQYSDGNGNVATQNQMVNIR